jgi:hypothetical protein
MKLFTIGDSISQGFMSLAAARTDLSYSTLLAQALGLKEKDYRYPKWEAGGLPVNLELIFRALHRRYGVDISLFEWLTVLQTINDVVDVAEEYYERGLGRWDNPYDPNVEYFHNVSVKGFDVADAWLMTAEIAEKEIKLAASQQLFSDGYLSGPDVPFYRTTQKVLNPSGKSKYKNFSQLTWLDKHTREEGIENVVLWLGANNALGTIISLKINQTPNRSGERPYHLSHIERAKIRKWNLWHPDDFKAEYEELLKRVDKCMQQNQAANWHVFVGNVPLVTIAPLAKGVGEETVVTRNGRNYIYFKYYTYFPFELEFAHKTGIHLNMQDVIHIDDCIREYNKCIAEFVEIRNKAHGRTCYHIVDIAGALDDLAYKRNNGNPIYEFPKYFDFIYPKVNTKYYHADKDGILRQGGIFSLDGIHPTAIGHGLIAHEFLKVMKKVGIVANKGLDWEKIFEHDLLYQKPIPLMHELYGYDKLAVHIVNLIKRFKEL